MLARSDSIHLDLLVNLQDQSITKQAASREQAILGFNSPYELEKALIYPNWSPVYFYWRPILLGDRVEHATGNHWKGFITAHHIEDKKRWNVEASLYDYDERSSGCIEMNFKDDQMSLEEAKELLASLRFGNDKEPYSDLFSRGKEMMPKGGYARATALFLTAFRRDTLNADYAYHLARSLFEDKREISRETRLRSAMCFLERALSLDPGDHEATKLLLVAEEEYGRLEQRKSQHNTATSDLEK